MCDILYVQCSKLVISKLTLEGLLAFAFIGFVLGLKFIFCQKFSMDSNVRNCSELEEN